MIQPRHDRVLIRRLEGPPIGITITDAPKSIKGQVLAVGPDVDTVKVGMTVLFNSKWNDLAHAENIGTGADGKGPLERPLSYKLDKNIHLVREADIFGILTDSSAKAKLGQPTLEQEFFVNRKVPGPWSE
jgi:Chaperonin 10 Kd subunit